MLGISWISNLHRAVSFSVLLQRHCSTPIVAHHKHRGQRWIFEFRNFLSRNLVQKKYSPSQVRDTGRSTTSQVRGTGRSRLGTARLSNLKKSLYSPKVGVIERLVLIFTQIVYVMMKFSLTLSMAPDRLKLSSAFIRLSVVGVPLCSATLSFLSSHAWTMSWSSMSILTKLG